MDRTGPEQIMATSHPLPEGKEEVIPFQGQNNYFLLNDTPLLGPSVGKEWLFPTSQPQGL
jgi:hypothetical protein